MADVTEVATSPPTSHQESEDDDLPQCKIKRNYSCTLCNFFSQNPRSFLYHSRDVHFDKIKIYECSQCLYASKHSQKLQRHINMIHVSGREAPKKIRPQRPQPCVEEEGLLKCSVCSFTSRSTALITRHERVVHLKKRFMRCAKCSYVTHVKARFTKHVKYHSMPMIKCDLCDFRTPYKWNLDRHYKNHCGTGAFQCSKCNFRADIKQSLTVHEMNHHVPPVGAGAAILLRKKNKVGASEAMDVEAVGPDEDDILRLEREDDPDDEVMFQEETDDEEPDLNAEPPGKLESALTRPNDEFLQPEFSCRFCSFTGTLQRDVAHHEEKIHGKDKRPPPNLIPLQGNSPVPKPIQVNEDEFNEMCKNSTLTKSLKDMVSLIGDVDALKTIPDNSEESPMEELRKKNAPCVERINQKLGLICEICGQGSNSLEESAEHEKLHEREDLVVSGQELSSTRCQHCRQRCKTSADLRAHLLKCPAFATAYKSSREATPEPFIEEPNRVFVWNDFGSQEDFSDENYDDDYEDFPLEVQIETSPEPTPPSKIEPIRHIHKPLEKPLTLKKVFKCPHCNFWASTASRFHVHIVGHLNKKPFECSLCNYRSNWRWDITKHIRLKSARDPNHAQATVNMTDETGRRNYSKYNKYLTMMKVSEPTADSSGTGKRTRACDATQGTVKDGDILHPIPEPPKLTPAPATFRQGLPIQEKPRPLNNNGKKTLWKCKRCLYRNSEKEKVLAHVKTHYGNKKSNGTAEDLVSAQDEKEPTPKITARIRYKCGHCDILSNWSNVILRHCRQMHDGNVKIVECTESEGETVELADDEDDKVNEDLVEAETSKPPPTAEDLRGPFACDICPFEATSEGDRTAHKLNHIDRPGSIFKCSYCPFYVPSKIAVLEHMEVHGYVLRNVDHFENMTDVTELADGSTEEMKRFQCKECPYVSNSKTQFLYHKQFHKCRGAAFQCNYCSYNVSRRHLLHQHLRVHHTYRTGSDEEEIPLVWVLRDRTYLKMFKCRWCPHVNQRRANIQDHEKMHKDKFKFKCPDCSYTCSNANVLSSHVKVHSGCFGEIQTLVDPNKSDEEQIQSLQKVKEEIEPSTPESSYYQSKDEERQEEEVKFISFCNKCPARFMYKKELRIHSRFHSIRLPFKCYYCTYTARQRPHLLAHLKVHSKEYQKRTAELVDNYVISPDHPRPKTAMISKCSDYMEGAVWSVLPTENLSANPKIKVQGRHSCHLCPAKFFKIVALQYHLTLHGGPHQYKCQYCDYTVKTYGNLMKHQLVHTAEQPERAATPEKKPDPQFGLLMHGSPDFVYPRYIKNGKLKEKRYKCHKCPSAFEKRDQYRVHLSLHGSKQKYKCEKCDYSVKYYANYIQHMRKHKNSEDSREVDEPDRRKDDEKKLLRCELCPYSNPRKDCLENHERRHYLLSGIKYGFDCKHCDYSTTQPNFLREHARVHFKPGKPDAYMYVKGLEIHVEYEGVTEVCFKETEDGTFEPPLDEEAEEEDGEKLYVNLESGDLIREDNEERPIKEEPVDEDLIELVEVEKPKRLRGKNWRCRKCPHAFGKRDQYLRHVSLHGSQQRYSCGICDYSVKFYTNYVQHMRMHQAHDPDREIKINEYVAGTDVKSPVAFQDEGLVEDGESDASESMETADCDTKVE